MSYIFSLYFFAVISIFVFVRCFASPKSKNGGGCIFFAEKNKRKTKIKTKRKTRKEKMKSEVLSVVGSMT